MRSINTIVIHCSASPNGVAVSAKQIDAWHAARGFKRQPEFVVKYRQDLPSIGYHRLILADGTVALGRDTEEVGAHVQGHNQNSFGICIVGTDRFFLAQWQSLAQLLGNIAYAWQSELLPTYDRIAYPFTPALAMQQFKRMRIRIVGHRDLSPDKNGDGKITSIDWLKTCPGFSVADWFARDMALDNDSVLDSHPAISQPLAGGRLAFL